MQQPTQSGEAGVLKRVTVRLVREEERGEFDFRLEDQHYLHSACLTGQTLRYVAELDGEWVALICFGAAAMHLKGREDWIGWTPRRRARRLGFVVNNSRFLVLPDRQKYPNLASRVLGLCLRRLSADWQQQWGHPVLVVESFVDESRYRGTCYRVQDKKVTCGRPGVDFQAAFFIWAKEFRCCQKPSKSRFITAQRMSSTWPAPLTDQSIPDCFTRWPMTVLHPASTTPEPMK